MRTEFAVFLYVSVVAAVAAEESTTAAAAVHKDADHKDQMAASSDLDNDYLDLGSVSSGLLSPDSWKPIAGPSSQHVPDSGAEADVKTITLTKQVPVPYPVTVEKRVPVRVEVPVDKPYPVYVPRPYHVVVEKKVPYHVGVPVPQPYTVEKHVPVPVRVPVDKPVPVAVPHPYPVFMYRKVPYTVERHVPYPVKVPYFRHYPVHVPVEKLVPVPIEKTVPYPVHVAVERPVPVHVEKPVPYPVEKIVPYPVEKIVPVPYKVPVKVHVKVPVISHYPNHESGSNELYSATDNSQQHQLAYQVDETKEDTNDVPQGGGEYSEVYSQSGQNQWAQLGQASHHQSDASHSHYDGHVRFPHESEGAGAATNLVSDQENTYHQVGTYIKVDQGQRTQDQYTQGQANGQDDHTKHYFGGFVYSPGQSPQTQNYSPVHLSQQQQQEQQHHQQQHHQQQEQYHQTLEQHHQQQPHHHQTLEQHHQQQHHHHHHQDSGSTRQQQHGSVQHHNEASLASHNDIAEFEKRLKDGRQESYSKVNLGPTAFTNTVQHGSRGKTKFNLHEVGLEGSNVSR